MQRPTRPLPGTARTTARTAASLTRAFGFVAFGLFAAWGLPACSGGSSAEQSGGGSTTYAGVGNFFFEDPHFNGAATAVELASLSYGRLVELFALDATGARVLMASDYVIGQAIVDQPGDWLRESNPVTGQENLVILRNIDDATERDEFLQFAQFAANQVSPIQVRDLDDPLVSMVPRNAAIVIQFSDLLAPNSINQNTISLLQGEPPAAPSTPHIARIFPSRNFGGQSANGTFYPTRVVVDLTISEIEAEQSSGALNVNTLGMTASTQADIANVQLRIPTRINSTIGITNVVRNLAGSPLTTVGNGPTDPTASTRPVTRAFRSGGQAGVLADPYNGFLLDNDAPVVVGSTQIEIVDPPVQDTAQGGTDSLLFTLPSVQFASTICASQPEPGDVLIQSGVYAEVVSLGTAPSNGVVSNVEVRLIAYPDTWDSPAFWETSGAGGASYETAFETFVDSIRTECFVQILPLPTGFPADPGTGVLPESQFTVRFSEPMEPSSLTAFDSVTLTREAFDPSTPLSSSAYVVGTIAQSQDLREVTFFPRVNLSHAQGTAEDYFLRIANGDDDDFPPEDLAGNVVAEIPQIEFSLEPSSETQYNGGRVSRFTSIDEELPVGAEWGGNVLIDSARQLLRARPVLRSQVVLDNNQPLMNMQTYLPGGVVTPHSPYGSKMQTLWRYCDAGFSLTDPQDQNIDIEGLAWRPSGATITSDAFTQFEIRLAHCRRLPDEYIDPATAWPLWDASGLRPNFSLNVQQSERADVESQVIVHPRERGYTLDQGDLFTASTGTTMFPFPLNRDDSFDDNIWFTWRDSRIRSRAPNQNNGGTEPYQWFLARGLPAPPNITGYRAYYRSNQCQTIGLPLLMEFRVFPDLGALGQNAWDFNIAANSSSQPYFRAFSTGGTNTSGAAVYVNPDNEDLASGGFSPGSTPSGQPTPGRDNVVHHGQIDYITRVSHAHSIWFEADIAGEPSFGGRRFSSPTVEPQSSAQPVGTELRIEYRGATDIEYINDEWTLWESLLPDTIACPINAITEGFPDNDGDPQDEDVTTDLTDYQVNAFLLDMYGDYYNDSDNFNENWMGTGPTCNTPVTPPVPRVINPWPDHRASNANSGLSFLSNDDSWKLDVTGIRGARYYQVRLTFVGNPETGQTPEVSAFALTWTQD